MARLRRRPTAHPRRALLTPKHPDVRSRKWAWYANCLAPSQLLREHQRAAIYRWLGMELDSDRIKPGCFFQSSRFRMGRNSSLNYGCFIENVAPVDIGEGTDIGFAVRVITSSHAPGGAERRAGDWFPQPVQVGNGCWIGVGVTILPGVNIGDGCVVAAGAVVTRDCEPHGMYGGVPATRLRDLAAPESASD
jgi:maltose O-acetyltransferase